MNIPKTIRIELFNKYNGKCAYCGCDLQKGWHVDHVEPCGRINSGEMVEQPEGVYPRYKWVEKVVGHANPKANHVDNYMPSCPSCNINKHGDTIEQFRESIAGYLRSLNKRVVQYKMAKKYGLVKETNNPVVFYFETFNPHPENLNLKVISSEFKPKRIQRKRVKGWRMPENTVSVTRPGKWGNPFKVGDYVKLGNGGDGMAYSRCTEKKYAGSGYVHLQDLGYMLYIYREYLLLYPPKDINELKGKNLACFCKEGEPCHADILLELANTASTPTP